MSRIFISHSCNNCAEAIAFKAWLTEQGWDDVFLDVDPKRGLVSGDRWELALRKAASRCQIVVFIISKAWLDSQWCRDEFTLSRHLNKRLFAVLIEDLAIEDLPETMTREWQVTNLAIGDKYQQFEVSVPPHGQRERISFAADGLQRLRIGLLSAGLDPKYFSWPPEDDLERPPYRGLLPLESEDAGIFFGRDGAIVELLDKLRGLREAKSPRLLVILGASGAGKSSFLRAGILPRLVRDDRRFLPLPVVRPERAVLSGEKGFVVSLSAALKTLGIRRTRADVRAALTRGVQGVRGLVSELVEAHIQRTSDPAGQIPILVLCVDQAEELFQTNSQSESAAFLLLLRELSVADKPPLLTIFTIRSDNYEALQTAPELAELAQETFSLPPAPRGAFSEIVEGPARRLDGTERALEFEKPLVEALLSDLDARDVKDALPLLAFTLERLYREFGGDGIIRLSEYKASGRVKGAIEAAVERALRCADENQHIPRDAKSRMKLLRRGLIPWLASLDPETGAPHRRVAKLAEIPEDSRPLIELLVEQRLLTTDVKGIGDQRTVEPAHEALLRQWGQLRTWLKEDAGLLGIVENVKRSARNWAANGRRSDWLDHVGNRFTATAELKERPDISASLQGVDTEYLAACHKFELRKKRNSAIRYSMVAVVIGAISLGWWNRQILDDLIYRLSARPYVLNSGHVESLEPGDVFRECANCPQMVVVPVGSLTFYNEAKSESAKIDQPIAVSKFEVTFAQWDECVRRRGCDHRPDDLGWGRDTRPVINVSYTDALSYTDWISNLTGKRYRLLSDNEWTYSARAGVLTRYPWGAEPMQGGARCYDCDVGGDRRKTLPVGKFRANGYGLYDMLGNVFEWVSEDITQGRAKVDERRIVRGGSYGDTLKEISLNMKYRVPSTTRARNFGFRVVRELAPHAGKSNQQRSASQH